MKIFTLFWKNGSKEVIQGTNFGDAMKLAGYSSSVVAALDFYDEGNSNDWIWCKEGKTWQYAKEL